MTTVRWWSAPTSTAQAVYNVFREEQAFGATSYLHNAYKRGLADLPAPPREHRLQYAAWRAGRDNRKATTNG